jgi:hypothetical protein
MSQSRWSWQGIKTWLSYASQTRPARYIYSTSAGANIAASIAYIGTTLSAYFSPILTCFFAGTTGIAISAIRYNQLSVNEERFNEIEIKHNQLGELAIARMEEGRQVRLLEQKIERLDVENHQLLFAMQKQMEVLDKVVGTLQGNELRADCEQLLELSRIEIENEAPKLNPHSFYHHRTHPSLEQLDEDDEEVNKLLLKNLEDFNPAAQQKNPKELYENTKLLLGRVKSYS